MNNEKEMLDRINELNGKIDELECEIRDLSYEKGKLENAFKSYYVIKYSDKDEGDEYYTLVHRLSTKKEVEGYALDTYYENMVFEECIPISIKDKKTMLEWIQYDTLLRNISYISKIDNVAAEFKKHLDMKIKDITNKLEFTSLYHPHTSDGGSQYPNPEIIYFLND